MPTISIKEVQVYENHLLSITFENGETGTFDMKPYLDFGVFKKIKDYKFFQESQSGF